MIDPCKVRAFARAMADAPDDQLVRDVFADYLLEEGEGKEAQASLLRSGELTGRHPYRPEGWYKGSAGNWADYTTLNLDYLDQPDRSKLPTEVMLCMPGHRGYREGGNIVWTYAGAGALWRLFVDAVSNWVLGIVPEPKKENDDGPGGTGATAGGEAGKSGKSEGELRDEYGFESSGASREFGWE